MDSLAEVETWAVPHASAAVVGPAGVLATHGDERREFRIASVAKLLFTLAALVAVEEGTVGLDDPAGPDGCTLRHLMAHASGLGFDGPDAITGVGRRRIYSNTGIEVAADHLAARTGMAYGDYLVEAVLTPLGMHTTTLRGSPAYGVWSTLADLARFARELLRPSLVADETLADAVTVQFPGLPGILPGVGRFVPCDWGLGFERNFGRPGHWAGTEVSPDSFGHFGGAGTFVVVEPTLDRAIVCLTDREFGPWALEVWPGFCDSVVRELRTAA